MSPAMLGTETAWEPGREVYLAVETGPRSFQILTFRVTQHRRNRWGKSHAYLRCYDAPAGFSKAECQDKVLTTVGVRDTRYSASKKAALRKLLKITESSILTCTEGMAAAKSPESIADWKQELADSKALCTKISKSLEV